MPVFLKPDRGNVFSRSMELKLTAGVELRTLSTDKYCKSIVLVTPEALKDKDGELLKDGQAKPGQRVHLSLGSVVVGKYHLKLEPNPELTSAGYLGGPMLLEPQEVVNLNYMFKTERLLDFMNLPYILRIYLID